MPAIDHLRFCLFSLFVFEKQNMSIELPLVAWCSSLVRLASLSNLPTIAFMHNLTTT